MTMSLAPISLRSISGIAGSSSIIFQPKDLSTRTMLSNISCCHLSDPACLKSLSCLASPPVLASSTHILSSFSSLTSLSKLSHAEGDEKYSHAMADMYGFHI